MPHQEKRLKIAVAVSGASGSVYAQVLLQQLHILEGHCEEVGIVWSTNAKEVWQYELPGEPIPAHFKHWDSQDFSAPIASGSAGYDALIICPCSMGTLGRIAAGISDSLVTRAADVMLKERKKLILVVRESPYNLIHIQNMQRVTEAGGIICPASPSFYSLPKNFQELAATVTTRALQLAGLPITGYQWGEDAADSPL